MRKLVRNALVAGAATTAAVSLAGTPAFAGPGTWNVTPTSTIFSATSTNPTLTNPRNSASLTCTSVTASGSTVATSLNDAGFVHAISPEVGHIDVPDTVANVISSSWTGCRGPINLTFGVTHAGTWTLQAISENSSTHVIKGRISGVHATIAGTGCSAMVSGSARGTYDNSAKTLTISEPGGTSGGLIVSGASCLGILANGDKPSFNATFSVTGNIAVHRNH